MFGAEGTTPESCVYLDSSTNRFSSSGSIRELGACGRGPCAQANTPGAARVERFVRRRSVRVSAAPFWPRTAIPIFFFSWSSRQPTRSVHECVDAARALLLLGAVVVVVATLFQGVGVEAPRAAALRRRAAEAPLVMSRQALAGAQRSARAAHHLESCWLRRSYAAQRRRRSATSLRDYLRASVL